MQISPRFLRPAANSSLYSSRAQPGLALRGSNAGDTFMNFRTANRKQRQHGGISGHHALNRVR